MWSALTSIYSTLIDADKAIIAWVWSFLQGLVKFLWDQDTTIQAAIWLIKNVWDFVLSVLPTPISDGINDVAGFFASPAVTALFHIAFYLIDQVCAAPVFVAGATMLLVQWPIFLSVKLVLLVVHHFWPGGTA